MDNHKGIRLGTDSVFLTPDLIDLARANPHMDWNEIFACAVKHVDEHPEEYAELKESMKAS